MEEAVARTGTDPDTYSGWQREKGGFFFGLDAVQTAFIALAALTIIDSLLRHSWSQLLIALPIAGGLVAAALVRIEGKTTAQWIQTYISVIAVRAHGAHRFEARPRSRVLDDEGEIAPPVDAADEWDLPGVLAPLRLLEAENAHGESLAVVHHRVDNTYTAVARVTQPAGQQSGPRLGVVAGPPVRGGRGHLPRWRLSHGRARRGGRAGGVGRGSRR
jgi:hypothetical protein